MHILIVSECYPTLDAPQYGIFVKQQAEELQKLGTTFDVLIPSCAGKSGSIEKCEAGGYYTIAYRLFRYNLFPHLAAKKYYREISSFLAAHHYDAVSVHITSDAILQLTVDACNRLSVPVVVHYHGLNVWEEYTTKHKHREQWYANRRYRTLCRTQAIVGVSQKVTDIVKARVTTVPTYTVYNGVDMSRFAPLEKEKRDAVQIVGVGNLIQIKGFQYLLLAFARLMRDANVTLHIVGDGIERAALQGLASKLSVSDKVTFYGKLPYGEVADMVRVSDLFVLPSFYEALGCVYLEAMACGVPAIGVKGMGIDEIIVDGKNGYLVEPCDVDDLYEKMKKAVADREALAKMGKEAYKTASEYTWEASAKSLNDIYQGLMR